MIIDRGLRKVNNLMGDDPEVPASPFNYDGLVVYKTTKYFYASKTGAKNGKWIATDNLATAKYYLEGGQ